MWGKTELNNGCTLNGKRFECPECGAKRKNQNYDSENLEGKKLMKFCTNCGFEFPVGVIWYE